MAELELRFIAEFRLCNMDVASCMSEISLLCKLTTKVIQGCITLVEHHIFYAISEEMAAKKYLAKIDILAEYFYRRKDKALCLNKRQSALSRVFAMQKHRFIVCRFI